MKRFYSQVSVKMTDPCSESDRSDLNELSSDLSIQSLGQTFRIYLDDKPIQTPGKHPLTIPGKAFADAVAAEWRAQTADYIDLYTMPLTRHVCTALDRITDHRDMTIAEIANFARSDLVCHRAVSPDTLVERQMNAWQPIVDWMAVTFQAPLLVTTGITPVEQPIESLDKIKSYLRMCTPMELGALHTLTAGMGSVVLALAVSHGRLAAAEAYDMSIIDEIFQTEHWGDDADWQGRRSALKEMIVAAETVLHFLKGAGHV